MEEWSLERLEGRNEGELFRDKQMVIVYWGEEVVVGERGREGRFSEGRSWKQTEYWAQGEKSSHELCFIVKSKFVNIREALKKT